MSNATIKQRQQKIKDELLEKLRKIPVVQIACEKSGVSRATYYRWRENPQFASAADAALHEGVLMMNDLAESQLLNAIRNQSLTAVIYWLKTHHKAYSTRVEVEATVRHLALTPEQEALVKKALTLSNITEGDEPNES